MLKKTVLILPLLAMAMMTVNGFGQTSEAPKIAEPVKFYKLDFVVKEVEGAKVLNTRSYSMTASSKTDASARTGVSAPFSDQYMETNVNIDCKNISESHGDLSLYIGAELTILESVPAPSGPAGRPTIHRNRWGSTVILPLKKPTVIFSSDDLTSKRQMQLELTATPIN